MPEFYLVFGVLFIGGGLGSAWLLGRNRHKMGETAFNIVSCLSFGALLLGLWLIKHLLFMN